MNTEVNQSMASSSRYSQRRNNLNSNSFRGDIAETQQQILSLQNEIQFTICNYQSILQTQKKNTSQRNQFLLYLIQSMKQKHNQQLNKHQAQLHSVIQQKQQANCLESQMKNIGDGVDTILEEGKKLKETNFSLMKQLEEQKLREKQIDEEIDSHHKEIEQLRAQVDEWEVKKLKWNRKKKDMVQMIEDTQNNVMRNIKLCQQTGLEQEKCEHCQSQNMKKIVTKYQQYK